MREQLRALWLMLKAEVVTPTPRPAAAGDPEQPWAEAVAEHQRRERPR